MPWGVTDGSEPGTATLRFDRATVDGELTFTALTGALHTRGELQSFDLRADALTITVVRTRMEFLDNPLGGDIALVTGTEETRYHLLEASLRLDWMDAASVVYVYRDEGVGGGFDAPLGLVRGEPFRPTTEPSPFVVTEPGQRYAFAHEVPEGAFAVGTGRGGAAFRGLGEVAITGALMLVLDHLTFTAEDDSQHLQATAGSRRSHEPHGSVPAVHSQGERTYAKVEADGATLTMDVTGSEALLQAREPTYRLVGLLRVPSAEGTVRLGEQVWPSRGKAVEMEGDLALRLRAAAARPGFLEESHPHVRANVEGEVESASVGGRVVGSGLPPEAREASLLAAVTGLFLAAFGALQKGLAPVLLPFYARLSGRDLLSNRHRLHLYRLIREHPFIHLRELQRATGLGFGTVAYHISVLRREQMVASVRTGREELYYIPSTLPVPAAAPALAMLADPTRRRIAEELLHAGGATQEELARRLRRSRGRVSRHLGKLERAGLVEARSGRNRRYAPTALLQAWCSQAPVLVWAPTSSEPAGALAAAK